MVYGQKTRAYSVLFGSRKKLNFQISFCYAKKQNNVCEFSFFLLPNKAEWALVYCPETPCLHFSAFCAHCTEYLDQYTREMPYVITSHMSHIRSSKLHLHSVVTFCFTGPKLTECVKTLNAYRNITMFLPPNSKTWSV